MLGDRRYCYPLTITDHKDVGIKEVSEKIWLVSFMSYDLGYFDEDSKRFEPLENPFAAKVLPIGVKVCNPCVRYEVLPMCPEWTRIDLVGLAGFEPTTSRTPNVRATKLRYSPIHLRAIGDNLAISFLQA